MLLHSPVETHALLSINPDSTTATTTTTGVTPPPSTTTSTRSSVKRRRRQSPATTTVAAAVVDATHTNDDAIQVKLSTLRLPSPTPTPPPATISTLSDTDEPRSSHYKHKAGDAVEAIKRSTQDSNEMWYCARVVDFHTERNLVFVHYEGWPADHADWIQYANIRPLNNNSAKRHYGPRGKEDDASWKEYGLFYDQHHGRSKSATTTGLVHDRRMALHTCPCHNKITHPERPDRITCIFDTLHQHRLLRYVQPLPAKEATTDELLKAHTPAHVHHYSPYHPSSYNDATTTEEYDDDDEDPNPRARKIISIAALLNPEPPRREKGSHQHDNATISKKPSTVASAAASAAVVAPSTSKSKMICGQPGIAGDTTFHPRFSNISARVAAGALINMTDAIVQGRVRNGFAVIRPPGHHAQDDIAMGYCFFNNVAVAAASALVKYPNLIKRVLILDWDIHHGNGTQQIFYDNPNVLYISIHRWDDGHFYPFTGAPDECGQDQGIGRNVNISLSETKDKPKPMGDTEFIAAMHHIVTPIARQFAPDMIFVSAGFDAAEGHPANLGGYSVTPRGYAMMTKMIKQLADELCQGRLALSLEGGYELEPLANSATASIVQLLDTAPASSSSSYGLEYKLESFDDTLHSIRPNRGAVASFKKVIECQQAHWQFAPELTDDPDFRFELPEAWRAAHSISTRTRRTSGKSVVVKGY
ncbi:hypothetical protein K492DRAFT_173140 [Lichtheimia hyalospora FSU 10163]|nr:hypothetical protein K492DRAFT_173140 [Lichtheimia hyalospora FSU 10163]